MSLDQALKSVRKFNEHGIACSLSHVPTISNSVRSVNGEVSAEVIRHETSPLSPTNESNFFIHSNPGK